MKYEIFDNFLPENQFVQIDLNIVTPQATSWFLNDKLGTLNFSHTFYSNGAPNSDKFSLCKPLIEKLNVKSLMGASAFLYLQTNKLEKIKPVDIKDFTHKSAVYFLNTNNGYIMLNDKEKIQAIENRMVVFDNTDLTLMTNCTDKMYRAVIEFHYF